MEIKLKGIVDEDVVNYRKTSMFIIFQAVISNVRRSVGGLFAKTALSHKSQF